MLNTTAHTMPASSRNGAPKRNCARTRPTAAFKPTISCVKRWIGSKKPSRFGLQVTTMRSCAGTRARASSRETTSSHAPRKSGSNSRSNSCSRFALRSVYDMPATTDDFAQFEHEGWQRVASKYDSTWSSLTRQFIRHLLDAAQIAPGMQILDVCCGPGYVSAAVRERGAMPTGIDFSSEMAAIAGRLFPGITFREGDAQK